METSNSSLIRGTVYIETSIVSYLTARPSRDLLVAAHQQLTVTWWDQQRSHYELFTSQVVLAEARAGDPDAAQRRVAVLEHLPHLRRHGCGHYARGGARQRAGTPRASGPRCAPCRRCLRPRDRVSPDVELCTSGQCQVTELHRTNLPRGRLRPADYLYPRRTGGLTYVARPYCRRNPQNPRGACGQIPV